MRYEHTPGPWLAKDGAVVQPFSDVTIAVMAESPPQRIEANAALIAAAPAMLAALRTAEIALRHPCESYGRAALAEVVAAINQALGEVVAGGAQ